MSKKEIEKIVVLYYKSQGLKSALNYLFSNCYDETAIDICRNLIRDLYEKNGINYEEPYFLKSNVYDIVGSVKKYNELSERIELGSFGDLDGAILESNEKNIKGNIIRLVERIEQDIKYKQCIINLSIEEFVSRLFIDLTDRTFKSVYEGISVYLDYRGIILYKDSNISRLIELALTSLNKSSVTSQLMLFDSIKQEIVKEVESLLVTKGASTNLDLRGEKTKEYYNEMEALDLENSALQQQIDELQKRIETNNSKKKVLVEFYTKYSQ